MMQRASTLDGLPVCRFLFLAVAETSACCVSQPQEQGREALQFTMEFEFSSHAISRATLLSQLLMYYPKVAEF